MGTYVVNSKKEQQEYQAIGGSPCNPPLREIQVHALGIRVRNNIKYDNNDKSISVFFDADSLLLLSDTKKELNAN